MCLAVPGRLIKIAEPQGPDASPLMRTGSVDFGGVVKDVNLAYVPEAKIGDYVVVHVGFAISTMDESEANEVFEYLRQMEEAGDLGPGTTDQETPSGPHDPSTHAAGVEVRPAEMASVLAGSQ